MIDPFIPIVSAAGFLLSAVAAIGLTWRRSGKWDPHLTHLADAPSKVGGVVTMFFLGAMWFDQGLSFGLPPPQTIAKYGTIAAIAGLLIYTFLTTVCTYAREEATSPTETRTVKMIGGLWLTRDAKTKRAMGVGVQKLLAQAGYDPDAIWPRPARGLSELLFIASYLVLVCGGTIAVSAMALLVTQRLS